MKRTLAAVGLTAGLVAGSAAGLVLVPAAALGQTSSPPTTAPPAKARDEVMVAAPGEHLRDVLTPLVANGTITQAQADKVIAALQAAKPLHGPGGRHHRFHIAFDTVAKTLGVTEEALHAALRDGKSIADVARSKGVAPQSVVDALLAEARTRLAKEVADGDLTQAEADARLSGMRGKLTALVNGELPKFKRGGKRGPGDVSPSGEQGAVERSESPSA